MYTTNSNAANFAAELIKKGEIISVPTDTVYGICCNANNSRAVQKLFDIKHRTINKPISLCFSTVDEIKNWSHVEHIPKNLINRLLPGPYTLVLESRKHLNELISSKNSKVVVGVRIPENDFIISLCSKLDHPIALTSANVSGNKDSINVDEFKELWPYLSCVFDDGPLAVRAPSTVVDLSEPLKYRIIREGAGLDFVKKILIEYNYDAVI